jgi:acetyl esterase/lipase
MRSLLFSIAICTAITSNAQKVIPLYQDAAPGSEHWTWQEKEFKVDIGTVVLEVSKPTLTAFLPAKPNGTAVIIAPGGAFHALAFDLEGTTVAKRLNEKGITAFVLKYRLVHDDPAHPKNALMTLIGKNDAKKLDSIFSLIVPLAMQDGLTAVSYIRLHAAEYKINPGKIGFMGFSAGGTVTMSVVYNASDENRPNFVAPIYTFGNAVIGSRVPAAKTPIFIAVASDDDFGFAPYSVRTYSKWLEAKQPAELHVYEKGGHGFGTKKQNLPVDTWMDRFYDWLKMQGYLSN